MATMTHKKYLLGSICLYEERIQETTKNLSKDSKAQPRCLILVQITTLKFDSFSTSYLIHGYTNDVHGVL